MGEIVLKNLHAKILLQSNERLKSEKEEDFLRKVCSSKLLLNHGRKKIEESFDFEHWLIGISEISLSSYKLHIMNRLLPIHGDSIVKITTTRVGYKIFSQE